MTAARHRCPHGRVPARERGFNLLEALVALAIASIAFTALYRAVGQSAKVASDVESRVEAALVARSVLARATYAEDLAALQAGQDGAWRWSLRVDPQPVPILEQDGAPVPLPVAQLARVQVSVARADAPAPVLDWIGWKPYRAAP